MLSKHPKKIKVDERINLFLKRVCFRVFEVIFATLNQMSQKSSNLHQKYLKLKLLCQNILIENHQDKSYHLLKLITDFTYNKLVCLINNLETITENLENGNLDEIEKLKDIKNTNKIVIKNK